MCCTVGKRQDNMLYVAIHIMRYILKHIAKLYGMFYTTCGYMTNMLCARKQYKIVCYMLYYCYTTNMLYAIIIMQVLHRML